jgi:REP element-mobilizing transposase RayT
MVVAPIYLPDTTSAAWQLDWSVTVFWRSPPMTDDWLNELRSALEPDGIRLLEHRFSHLDRSLFWVSTLPRVKPVELVQRIKGRLQYVVRRRWPKALRRNYDLHSIGSTRRDKAEQYVATQLQHHYPDDPALRAALCDLQIVHSEVDLSQPRFTAHARYRCNLHLVVVHQDRWRQSEFTMYEKVRNMIRGAATAKGHMLSRLGLLPDHLHLALGFWPDESPQEIPLSYMNNIAYVYGMQPVLKSSYFVGTIGEYDLGALGPFA